MRAMAETDVSAIERPLVEGGSRGRGQEARMQEQPAAAYEVPQSPEAGSTGRFSPRQEAAHTIFRAVLVPSRYNVSVDLSDGRAAVYNTFSAALTILPRAEWQRILGPGARVPVLPGAVAPAISRLHASGFGIPAGTDEGQRVRRGDR